MLHFLAVFTGLLLNPLPGFAAAPCPSGPIEYPADTMYRTIDKRIIQVSLTGENPRAEQTGVSFYVFVSLSMPKPALIALNQEARRFGAALVLRGLKDNQHTKTLAYLHPIIENSGQGFLIHPQWFTEFKIDKVPTFVLSKTDVAGNVRFDKVSGHVSLDTALKHLEKYGELAQDAKQWRERYAP